jgi:hypothetical protein
LESGELARLQVALLQAHEGEDPGLLVGLYRQAGEVKERGGEIDAACFYYTHAYVYALETGHPDCLWLNAKLVRYGRDESI